MIKFMILIIVLLSIYSLKIVNGEEDWYVHWFNDQLNEIIDEPKPLKIEGNIPSYIEGRLMRVGPTQIRTDARNYTNYLDGFGRISSWIIDGKNNQVNFLSSILKTNLFNASKPVDNVASEIARHITQEPTDSKTRIGAFSLDNMDNTDVNVYKFKGESKIITMTDFYKATEIDQNSLRTLGSMETTFKFDMPKMSTFSGSHPGQWYDPVANEDVMVNWLGSKGATDFKLSIYTMSSSREIVSRGRVSLPFQPYSIHSIAVAGNYALVTLGPVKLDFLKTGATLCVSCSADDKFGKEPTRIYVFDLLKSHKEDNKEEKGDAPPIAIIEMPIEDSVFVFHHINAQVHNENEVSLDYCGYSSTDGWLGEHVLGNINDVMQPEVRDDMNYLCDSYTRVTIDVKNNKFLTRTDYPMVDNKGNKYHWELSSINPNYWGKDYCYAYGTTYHMAGSSRYEDTGIIKIDRCVAEKVINNNNNGDTTTIPATFYEEGRYTGEPIFVPNPNPSSEDDGTVLVVTRFQDTSSLLMLDGKTLNKVASVEAPFPLVFEFHGAFFPGLE
jgi:carotenoid cleavage dioxygenase-like enzyme